MKKLAHAKQQQELILGAESQLEGHIRHEGPVRLRGVVCGNVSTRGRLTVERTSRVLGEVEGADVSVCGRVDGIVSTRGHLSVSDSGRIQGHARFTTLEVARGGLVEGSTSIAREPCEDDEDD